MEDVEWAEGIVRKHEVNHPTGKGKRQDVSPSIFRAADILLGALKEKTAALEAMESHARTVVVRHHSGQMQDDCAYNLREILRIGEEGKP